ncbi:unnamed protein product [Fusarium equiseti]|uniref:Heterokaryon incompatibility domain-containing protein n=1 Tax=Fusarium equiseti TaxID=61235 RepID=A0A8J2NHB6_FUSEQ|nr:unnamed protein product [Fusarium equiseti]
MKLNLGLSNHLPVLARVKSSHLVASATIIVLVVNVQRINRLLAAISKRLSAVVFSISQAFFGFTYSDTISNKQIRLIRLLDSGSSSSSSPNITLHTFDLNQCPPYLALSYTWGPAVNNAPFSPNKRYTITLDGSSFIVQPNLYDALSQLCLSRPGHYLWVDGICINQKDLTERSTQVAIMDHIYNGAFETIVWLGTSTDKTNRSVEIVQQIAKGAEAKIIDWGKNQAYGDVFIADDPEMLKRNGLPSLTADDWVALGDIYTRAWFGRTWMIQEVALSRTATVLIGNHEVPWDAVGDTAGLINMSGALVGLFSVGSDLQPIPLIQSIIHASDLHVTRQWSQDKQSRYRELLRNIDYSVGIRDDHPKRLLLELLLSSIGFRATIPRDRVYSLIGIVNYMNHAKGQPRLDLKIDYESSDDVVLTQLGIDFLEDTKSLHLLSLAGIASRAKPSNLPTWIPSFDLVHAPVLGPSYTTLPQFDASAGAEAEFTINKDLHRLNVKAFSPHLGSIEELGELWSDVCQGNFNNTMKMLLHCGTTYLPTGQPIVEAFWRTLIMDSDLSQRPAPSHLAESFSKWMLLVTIKALIAFQSDNPSIYDQFDALEPLWTLANTRDSTNTLPKTSDMIPLLFELGLRHDPTVRVNTESENHDRFTSWGRVSAHFETLLRINIVANRRLVRTVRGYLCLVPLHAKVGDRIMIISGCATPVVLRRKGPSDSCFQVVGDAYVHGAMFGEHITGDFTWRDIHLI